MAPGRVLIIAAFLFCNSVFADVANIEPGLPAEIADAEPIKQGEKQVQLLTVWDRQRNGDNRFVAEPQLQWGFAPRWQAALSVLGIAGSAEHTGSGDVRLQVMRKLNDENSL